MYYICVCAHVDMHIWRPQVNLRCCSSGSIHLCFIGTKFGVWLAWCLPTRLRCLACELQEFTVPTTLVPELWAFTVTSSLFLQWFWDCTNVQWVFHHLSHLPSSVLIPPKVLHVCLHWAMLQVRAECSFSPCPTCAVSHIRVSISQRGREWASKCVNP